MSRIGKHVLELDANELERVSGRIWQIVASETITEVEEIFLVGAATLIDELFTTSIRGSYDQLIITLRKKLDKVDEPAKEGAENGSN